MIAAVDRHRTGKVELDELAAELHGAMQAGDFRDDDLVRRWHDRWGPLEEWRATEKARRVPRRIEECVDEMRSFLLEVNERSTKG